MVTFSSRKATLCLMVMYAVLDDSMRQLYDGGNGQVLSIVTRWLASDTEHLHNSAALAIGNMARSGNCDVHLNF